MNIKQLRGRKWLITINNPSEKGIKFDDIKKIIENKWKGVIYYCYCQEEGNETHTIHIHIFLYVKNAISGSSLLKVFEGAHLDLCNGSCKENRDYVYKTGKYEGSEKEDTRIEGMQYESGECPEEKPGKRNDLEQLKELIKEGKTNAQIYEINPKFQRLANTIDKIRLDILSDQYGNKWRDVEVTYIEGATGTGKTRGIMEEYGYTNVYRIMKDDYSFSTYTMQPVVIFEEFRNTFKVEDMLNLLDGYPIQGRAMFGFRQLGYNKVFLCSNWTLSEQYQNIQEDHPSTWQAFLRRINKVIVRTHEKDYVYHRKNRGTKESPDFDFISADCVSYFDPFNLYQWESDDNIEDNWQAIDTEITSWNDMQENRPRKEYTSTDEQDYSEYLEEYYEYLEEEYNKKQHL